MLYVLVFVFVNSRSYVVRISVRLGKLSILCCTYQCSTIYLLREKRKTQISNLVRTTRFWNNLHQVTLKVERLENQIIFGSNKPKTICFPRARFIFTTQNKDQITGISFSDIKSRHFFFIKYFHIFVVKKSDGSGNVFIASFRSIYTYNFYENQRQN